MMNPKHYCEKSCCGFEGLPFYWHPLEDYRNNSFPEVLPFELFYDESAGLLRQRLNQKVKEVLKSAYKEGCEMVGLMEDKGIGYSYAEDFLGFIDRTIGLKNIAGKEILEIGCGTGYLLHRLNLLKGKVLGYEPGFAKIGKYNIPIVEKFFPSQEIKDRKFDIIIAYGLLEHLTDMDKILSAIHESLKDSGSLLLSVPDCKDYIDNGDISMLFHGHFSYFTMDSFRNLLVTKDYAVHGIERANFGGALYGFLKKDRGTSQRPKAKEKHKILGDVFGEIDNNIEKTQSFFKRYIGRKIGIYMPIRALNILFLCKDLIKESNITLRFFDDSDSLTGRYLPGFEIEIEDRNFLIAAPPDVILVCSYSFGKKVVRELREVLPKRVEIVSINDL
ncbi:MAG: class I SAM-dependent methyltransferase [Candidatus Omnitrophica bacterium]|nr:class I SAM-dependent methyltransferase [Candidatus Omnitrophota bacterium]